MIRYEPAGPAHTKTRQKRFHRILLSWKAVEPDEFCIKGLKTGPEYPGEALGALPYLAQGDGAVKRMVPKATTQRF